MEQKLENEMETGVIQWLEELVLYLPFRVSYNSTYVLPDFSQSTNKFWEASFSFSILEKVYPKCVAFADSETSREGFNLQVAVSAML